MNYKVIAQRWGPGEGVKLVKRGLDQEGYQVEGSKQLWATRVKIEMVLYLKEWKRVSSKILEDIYGDQYVRAKVCEVLILKSPEFLQFVLYQHHCNRVGRDFVQFPHFIDTETDKIKLT